MEKDNWEKRFDDIQNKNKYTEYTSERFCCGGDYCDLGHLEFIKSFIRKEKELSYRQGVTESLTNKQ